ncbi:hypothetical protein EST38_g4435 [Candolleomyces aberdarensis]|uniref:F-box domain-containing protein n=1 Tax=Candolleomyces aberdarensis TaxID=2316362 RepID=A0A4Q2DMM4_9AGAR|nr:hypothetical protein EST38_g4435 [Candolleomyces aberdarensis]
MSTPDLPPELWLEILSYLPRTYIYKMMGLNRLLFELAMQDKYEEIRLISDDKNMLNTFEQLRHDNISRLVRRLYLRPAFLPGIDEPENMEEDDDSSLVTSFSWLSMFSSKDKPHRSTNETAHRILIAAGKALPKCQNLREIVIIIYDHVITNSFQTFLSSLWRSIGDGIQKLTVATTLIKIPKLLKYISEHAQRLPHLESLDITIVNSRFPIEQDTELIAARALVNAIQGFKGTLEHLTLSSVAQYDFSPLFKQLGNLPKLRKLELWFILCRTTLSNGQTLVDFLRANQDNLEHLVLRPRPRFETFLFAQDTLRDWVLQDFPNVASLPRLKTLDLGHKYTGHISSYIPPWNSSENPDHLPTLPSFLPQLQSLKLTNTAFSLKGVNHVLEAVGGQISSLQIHVWSFSPGILSLLVTKAPNLASLHLTYDSLDAKDELTDVPRSSASPAMDNIYLIIKARRYPKWPLEYLRIGSKKSCGECHPDTYLANTIVEALSREIVVDSNYVCFCDGRFRMPGLSSLSDL